MSRDPRPRRRHLVPLVAALLLLAIIATALAACGSDNGESTEKSTSTTTGSSKAAPESFFGIVPQDLLEEADYKEMAEIGVRTLRVGLYWTQVQPDNGDDFDFTNFDANVKGAAENGITVLPIMFGTPPWVGELDGRDCAEPCNLYAPESDAALEAWKAYATKSAERYGPGGEFWKEEPDLPEMPITAWQIWNEQNSKTFFLPKPDPVKYEKLLGAAVDGIRSVDPDATIILGGMFGTPGGGDPKRSIAAATFLHELLAIDGAKEEFDGYALHPYSHTVSFVRKQVEIARRELADSGYPDASLWVTEVGWASSGKKSPVNVGSEEAQAERLREVYDLFESERENWNVKLVAWFTWQDSHISDDFCFFCSGAGLLDEQGEPKEAYDAYRDVAQAD